MLMTDCRGHLMFGNGTKPCESACVQSPYSCQAFYQLKAAGWPRSHQQGDLRPWQAAVEALLLPKGQACLPCTILLPKTSPKPILVAGLVTGPTLAQAAPCPGGVLVPADVQGRPQALHQCKRACRPVPAAPVSCRGSFHAQLLHCN